MNITYAVYAVAKLCRKYDNDFHDAQENHEKSVHASATVGAQYGKMRQFITDFLNSIGSTSLLVGVVGFPSYGVITETPICFYVVDVFYRKSLKLTVRYNPMNGTFVISKIDYSNSRRLALPPEKSGKTSEEYKLSLKRRFQQVYLSVDSWEIFYKL